MSTDTFDVNSLVSELQNELDNLETLFLQKGDDIHGPKLKNVSKTNRSFLVQSDAGDPRRLQQFLQAETDGDKELLQDKLQALTAQSEIELTRMTLMQANLSELMKKNECLELDNAQYKDRIAYLESLLENSSQKYSNDELYSHDKAYKDLEFKYAQSKSYIAQLLQAQDDITLAKEALDKEIEIEQRRRLIAEKERDAYISAYESSLEHFEKWSKVKLKR